MSTLPALVSVMLEAPHWKTISFSAVRTSRSLSTATWTVAGAGSGCQSLPRMIGWLGSPCSNETARSRPTSVASSATVERADTGRRSGFPGKFTRGAPPSSNAASVATTTPSIRGGADGGVNNSSAASPLAACGLGAGMVRTSVLEDLLALEGHVLGRLADDLAGPLDRDVLALDEDRPVLLHRDARRPRRQGDGVGRGDRQGLADVQRVGAGDGDSAVLADRFGLAAGHGQRLVLGHALGPCAADGDRLVLRDVFRPAAADGDRLVLGDVLGPSSADRDRLVLGDLLRSRAVNGDRLVPPDLLGSVLVDRDRLVRVDRLGPVAVDDDRLGLVNGLLAVSVDGDRLVVVDRLRPVVLDQGGLVVVDRLLAVVPDPVRLVVLDLDVLVLLGVDVQLFGTLLILEADLVVVAAAPPWAGPGLDAALGLVPRQTPRGHLVGVVDAADDDRVVRVTLQKVDNHLLADPRDVDHAPLLACPHGPDADPAGAVGVVLALAVPVGLDFDPAVLVAEDLLPTGANDDGRLRPQDRRPWGHALRAEWDRGRDAFETVLVGERISLAAAVVGRELTSMLDAVEDVVPIGVEVLFQGELVPGGHLSAVAAAVHDHGPGRFFLHAQADGALVVGKDLLESGRLLAAPLVDAVEPAGVESGVVVQLQLGHVGDGQLVRYRSGLDAAVNRLVGLEVLVRQLEGVVEQRDLAGPKLLCLVPTHHALLRPVAARHFLVDELLRDRHVRVASRGVGQDHLVSAGRMLEEVEDALLLHDPAGEREVALAILNAIVPLLE